MILENALTVGSLFSGIGGLDLGLERAGMQIKWNAELDPYCCRVLAKHWPHVPNLGDVTLVDWNDVERVDLICGGYPCQPFSLAGARGGESDRRHLWPFMRDALSVLRPRFALLENVPGHLSLGFGRVLGDLADLGYDARWDCVPAAAVGAPHLRYRVFVVAHPTGCGRDERSHGGSGGTGGPRRIPTDARGGSGDWAGADSNGGRQQVGSERDSQSPIGQRASFGNDAHGFCSTLADTHRTLGSAAGSAGEAVRRPETIERPGRRGSSDGDHWAVEPDVGRVAHGVPHRVDRLRGLGNAVVPQVAEFIGSQLLASLSPENENRAELGA